MNFVQRTMSRRTLALTGLAAALASFGCAATPATSTVSNSDVTTRTSAGGQTQTTVRETNERGPNGSSVTERTETVRTTTPGATPTPPRP